MGRRSTSASSSLTDAAIEARAPRSAAGTGDTERQGAERGGEGRGGGGARWGVNITKNVHS